MIDVKFPPVMMAAILALIVFGVLVNVISNNIYIIIPTSIVLVLLAGILFASAISHRQV